jgi:hypothetical protein
VDDRVADQRRHVLVGKSVEDVFGLASPPDQPHQGQDLQSRRHSGDLPALVFSQFRHASLGFGEPQQKPKPFRSAKRSEHLGAGFNLSPRWEGCQRTGWMPAMPAAVPRSIA